MEKLLFTSESVTEGHPDKICDQISDAVLDALMEQDPMSRVACETSITTGLVLVMGEITTKAYVDIQKIVRETIREIGYDRAKYGFDCDTCGVITAIDEQSAEIPVTQTPILLTIPVTICRICSAQVRLLCSSHRTAYLPTLLQAEMK